MSIADIVIICILAAAVVFSFRRCTTAGGWSHLRKGGETMRLTITLTLRKLMFQFIVHSRNRHSGK